MEELEISEDSIVEILLRLPIQKLIQFKIVSKQWLRLLTSPSFAFRLAQVQNFNRGSSFLVLRCLLLSSSIVPVSSLAGKIKIHPQIELPQMETYDGIVTHELFSAGYGIYCLFEPSTGNVVLWNPTIKQVKPLPPSPHYPSDPIHQYHFGIVDYKDGYFSYKVGRVTSTRYPHYFERRKDRSHECLSLELYSSTTNSWKFIPNFSTGQYLGYSDRILHCANLNGRVHWVIQPVAEDTYVTTFDYEIEVFGRIKAPSHPEVGLHYDKRRCIVTLFDDKFLCLVLFLKINDETWYVDIWVMREYGVEDSWIKVFTVGPIPKGKEVLGFSSKLQSLFLCNTHFPTGLLLWDCNSSDIRKYRMIERRQSEQYMQVVEYVESLVSIP